jgi:excinuclease ABC subunit A
VSSYAKQFLDRLPRPDVDSITGLTPAVAIQQIARRVARARPWAPRPRSTDYLRLLFARLGVVHCKGCGARGEFRHPAVDRS